MNVDALFLSVFVDNAAEDLDHFLFARMRLAIDDRFVLSLFAARDIGEMLLRKPIVPAAIPCRQIIGVFLKGVGQLRAGQGLHV